MKVERLAIFGSTGSIGTQTVDLLCDKVIPHKVTALSANNNYRLLSSQANFLRPDYLFLNNLNHKASFEALLEYKPLHIGYGIDELESYAETGDFDILLNSLVGFAGFMSTYKALRNDKRVALANKESLVVGGEILTRLPAFKEHKLIPVDSEHSAMLQSIVGESMEFVKRIIITASGGPFRNYTLEQMSQVTVEDALKHPNWQMGSKITIDSSTMMNKGLEIIEAKWLFNLPVEQIIPVIHPQSVIHSIVEFIDGSSKAQLGPPDMKVPILYALTYPDRLPSNQPVLDYDNPFSLDFEPVDLEIFPCLALALEAAQKGGAAPAVLNASNEVAVERFLKKEIHYIQIAKIIKQSLDTIYCETVESPDQLMQIDRETRDFATNLLT